MGKIERNFGGQNLLHELNTALARRRTTLAAVLGADLAAEAGGAYITEDPEKERFEVRGLTRNLATFALQEFPGCCGAVVSFYSEVCEDLRKKGLGQVLLEVRLEAARRMKYGLMLATVLADNAAERALLNKNGWKELGEFRNPKTGNLLVLMSTAL